MTGEAQLRKRPGNTRAEEDRRFTYLLILALCVPIILIEGAFLFLGLVSSQEVDGGKPALVIYAGLLFMFSALFAAVVGLIGYCPAKKLWFVVTGQLQRTRIGELGTTLIAMVPLAILLSVLAAILICLWYVANAGDTPSISRLGEVWEIAKTLSALATILCAPITIGGWIGALFLHWSNPGQKLVD